MTYALAAAGTGGHVYPALAVADALVARGVSSSDIVFFGGNRLEARAVPEAGYELVQLELRGLQRSLTAKNLGIPNMLRSAIKRSKDEMSRRGTAVVLAFGGYVTVPVARAALALRLPYFLHEQNAEPGLANRMVARKAAAVFCAFEPSTRKLPRAIVIGNPLRVEFADFDRAALRDAARDRYGLARDAKVLGVLGGSQGAKILNEAVGRIAGQGHPGMAVLHLAGSAHAESVEGEAAKAEVPWKVIAFEKDMRSFYAAADLVLSRAGALTVSELARTRTPSIVVPYAAGTAGHQAANARDLESVGASVVVDESDIATIPGRVLGLLNDEIALVAMSDAAAGADRGDAAGVLADRLLEVARGQ
ncbi:MAG: UDP-N-acetylglucosamine--N-acetylmuramyl-(pentapeptide) pyrophosphoryl-undecaprenol N-acetylglucosamine transferase [Acidimicrobiia bacterium]|nr:UDP-N-acetylglucosamine--N-acetylmuramyl-(pentapeptide) pyrophosphoryl-undecaprenol N-acetylglucosamine transferase [Acidimicrobiia bacterium]